MKKTLEYLNSQFDWSNPEVVSARDDLSLWSAHFGQILLRHIKLGSNITLLDIGPGTGFPLLELAQRLGNSSVVYGIDSWKEALKRVKLKIKIFNIKNVKLIEGDASSMSFKDDLFDRIVSNLGINNFKNPEKVLSECFRVAKYNAQIALTTNPKGHMKEFYDVYRKTLQELQMNDRLKTLESHMNHRLNVDTICNLLEKVGFKISTVYKTSFTMRFVNGTAFLNHFFIKYAFLDGWKSILPTKELNNVYTKLKDNLNLITKKENELQMSVPIAYIEGKKSE